MITDQQPDERSSQIPENAPKAAQNENSERVVKASEEENWKDAVLRLTHNILRLLKRGG